MVDLEKIQRLTPDEVEVVCAMQEMTKTAEEMSELVRNAYHFRLGEDRIRVWNDEHNAEFLTHDGWWQARYIHQEYEVTCTKECIFKYLVAEYIVNNNLHKDAPSLQKAGFEEEAMVFGYFRAFIERTKNEHPELCRADEDT